MTHGRPLQGAVGAIGRASNRVLAPIDRLLGRVTMYRLVTLALLGLAAVSVVYAATGVLEPVIFSPGWMLFTAAVLVGACVLSNLALAQLFRRPAHSESAVITALLLWFLHWPASDLTGLAWLLLPAVAAMVSKYVVAWQGRHLFNPAAAGVVVGVVVQHLLDRTEVFTTWWIASEPMLGWVAVATLLVWRRTNRFGLGLTFVVLGMAGLVVGLHAFGSSPVDAARSALVSYPLLFAAGFMLTEPLTLAPRRWQQLLAAAVAALLFVWGPLTYAVFGQTPELWIFTGTQEIALLAANLVGFAFRVRGGSRLTLVASRREGDLLICDFDPGSPVGFTPGQYAELQVNHPHPDARGSRRTLSIASVPGSAQLRFAVRMPAEPSTFKRALAALPVGSPARITSIGGDFVLPDPDTPLLLVAGGIGITPFLAQVDQLRERDVVLVYGHPAANPAASNPTASIPTASIAFAEELSDLRVLLVVPGPTPADLPATWSHLDSAVIEPAAIESVVDDLESRVAMVSGSPAMVHAVAGGLRGRAAAVHTDLFSGY